MSPEAKLLSRLSKSRIPTPIIKVLLGALDVHGASSEFTPDFKAISKACGMTQRATKLHFQEAVSRGLINAYYHKKPRGFRLRLREVK